MRLLKAYTLLIILLSVGCMKNSEQNDIKDAVKTYIHETDMENVSYISVRELRYRQLNIYRIMSEIVYDGDKLPSEISKIDGYYVFLYLKNKPEINQDKIPEKITKTKESFDREKSTTFYNPDEWVLAVCGEDNQKKLLKHTAHKPIDEIKEISQMKCK